MNGLRIVNPRLAGSRPLARPYGPCPRFARAIPFAASQAAQVGRLPVCATSGRPDGAAVYQPRASAAPPWVGTPPTPFPNILRSSHQAQNAPREPGGRHLQSKAASKLPQSKGYRYRVGARMSAERRAWGQDLGAGSSKLGAGARNGFRWSAENRPAAEGSFTRELRLSNRK